MTLCFIFNHAAHAVERGNSGTGRLLLTTSFRKGQKRLNL